MVTILLVILSLLFLFILFFSILFIVSWKQRNKKEKMHDKKADQENSSLELYAKPYMLVDIDVATDGFNDQRIIGKGHLGTVYSAVLTRGEIVAVKRIHPHIVLSHADFDFSSTLKWLSLANHPNVVRILGYSEGPGERIVVMEYLSIMSLEFYLHQSYNGASLFNWGLRFKVAVAAARGLEYLNESIAPNIIHGCVKPSNILIDDKFCVKLCDYGLTFLAPNIKQGLVGYVDEEYWSERKGASKESDVYGLGIVLLELLSGRKSERGLIVKWSLPLIQEMKINEFLDPRLVIPCDMKPLVALAKVAYACVCSSKENRFSIGEVVVALNNLEDDFMVLREGSP